MTSRKTAFVSGLFLIGGLLVFGCQQDGSGSSAPSAQASVAPSTPQPVQDPDATRLTSGTAPMQYLVASGGPVRVVDATDGKVLLKTTVSPQTLVRIDNATGVRVGTSTPVLGPLPENHRYEIWLDRR